MSAVTIDTLKFTQKLKDAGVPGPQAEAEAAAINEAFGQALDTQVATKVDMQAVRDDIIKVERRIDGLEGKITLLQWMLGFVLAMQAAILLKTF